MQPGAEPHYKRRIQMKLKNIELAIFDMDGTMLDTEVLSNKGWEVAVAEQVPNMSKELFNQVFNKMLGTNLENCKRVAAEYLPSFDFDKGHTVSYAFMDDYMKTHGVPIKPGLFHLLDKLEALGIKKCVATSTNKDRATHKLTMANIAHRFQVIVGGNEIPVSKPNPAIFLKAASLCNISPEKCLVLEDSAAGVEGGFRAGMQVVAIPDILQPSEETRKMATLVCKDLFEVAELLS